MVIVELLGRGSLIVAAALGLGWIVGRRSPPARHHLLIVGLALLIALPLQVEFGPRWRAAILEATSAPGPVRHRRALADLSSVEAAVSARAIRGDRVGAPVAVNVAIASRRWAGDLAVAIAAAGALVLVLGRLAGTWRIHRLVRRGRPLAADHPIAAMARDAAACLGVGDRYRIVASDECCLPFVAGVWRATVVVPGTFGSWPSACVRAVLLHELAHIQRRDTTSGLIADLACALHWYNPLVWLAARQTAIESELACDDQVVVAGLSPTRYASDLLRLTQSLRGRHVIEPALGIVRSDLGRRVERLVTPVRRQPPPLAIRSAGALALVAVGAGFAAIEPSRGQQPFRGSAVSTMNVSDGGPEISTNTAGIQARWVADGRHTGIFITGDVTLAEILSGEARPGRGSFVIAEETESGLLTYQWPSPIPPPDWVRRALRIGAGQLLSLTSYGPGAAPPAPRPKLAGSTLTGTPARSDDPVARVLQAGWIADGRRHGVFLRGRWRVVGGVPTTDDAPAWLDAFSSDRANEAVDRVTITRDESGILRIVARRNGERIAVDGAIQQWVAGLVRHANRAGR